MEYIVVLIAVVIATVFFTFVEKGNRIDVAAKAAAFILAVIVAAGMLGMCFSAANAEEAIISIKGTEPIFADGKLQLRVYFEYEGELLSWYEEVKPGTCFDTTADYHIIIENKNEVMDAEKEVKTCPSKI